jgi:hypothetical protein
MRWTFAIWMFDANRRLRRLIIAPRPGVVIAGMVVMAGMGLRRSEVAWDARVSMRIRWALKGKNLRAL